MCDQYVRVGKRQKWARNLMWAVCSFFDVYAISQAGMGTMHLFGRHTAIQSALHLFEVARAHIDRKLGEHLDLWEEQGRPNGKHKRTESTDFRYSAVMGLRGKLRDLTRQEKREEQARPQDTTALAHYDQKAAEQFMHDLHASKFGTKMRLRTEASARYSRNAAGIAAGRSVPMGDGIGSSSTKRLT